MARREREVFIGPLRVLRVSSVTRVAAALGGTHSFPNRASERMPRFDSRALWRRAKSIGRPCVLGSPRPAEREDRDVFLAVFCATAASGRVGSSSLSKRRTQARKTALEGSSPAISAVPRRSVRRAVISAKAARSGSRAHGPARRTPPCPRSSVTPTDPGAAKQWRAEAAARSSRKTTPRRRARPLRQRTSSRARRMGTSTEWSGQTGSPHASNARRPPQRTRAGDRSSDPTSRTAVRELQDAAAGHDRDSSSRGERAREPRAELLRAPRPGWPSGASAARALQPSSAVRGPLQYAGSPNVVAGLPIALRSDTSRSLCGATPWKSR